MMFVIGIVLFALAILISVALHECGHMWVARATGMKVRRYFVGFGPTLWSTRRGETEYGLKAVPLGGFCDIAGMTSVEELAPDEADRAMFKQATWKRVAVLFAGPGANFVICLVLLYAIALIWGLPNLHPPTKAIVGETACVAPEVAPGKLADCTGPGPAALAGIRPGDVIVKVGDTPVSTFDDMAAAIRKVHGNVPIVVDRDGTAITAYVDVTPTQRYLSGGSRPPGAPPPPSTVGAPGVGAGKVPPAHQGVFSALPARGGFGRGLNGEVGKAPGTIPPQGGGLVGALGGGRAWPARPR
ncbi:M50 family metallopeptidase, partial [Mycobacterium avium]|uniref:M50 family metallopeptidase n=1 Tax=Mycobacterium avium TaxID=1764 RepID=UPI0009C19CC2